MFLTAVCGIWPGDWEQFLSGLVSGLIATIIGTVIGIFGPFYLQSVSERRNKKDRAVQYLSDIKKELRGMKAQFDAINDKDTYLSPIKTPVWDSLINTNGIQLFSMLKYKDKTSDYINLTKQLFQIYDLINEYNLWWNMYAQGVVVGAQSEDALEPIKKFFNKLKIKLFCENADDIRYQESIKYTLDLIEKIEILNSDKTKGDAKHDRKVRG